MASGFTKASRLQIASDGAPAKPVEYPTQSDLTYARWDFSAWLWSGARHHEDRIKALRWAEPGKPVEWSVTTECDQNTARDLTEQEFAHLRGEVDLRLSNGKEA